IKRRTTSTAAPIKAQNLPRAPLKTTAAMSTTTDDTPTNSTPLAPSWTPTGTRTATRQTASVRRKSHFTRSHRVPTCAESTAVSSHLPGGRPSSQRHLGLRLYQDRSYSEIVLACVPGPAASEVHRLDPEILDRFVDFAFWRLWIGSRAADKPVS